jgi:hypothetical protein
LNKLMNSTLWGAIFYLRIKIFVILNLFQDLG